MLISTTIRLNISNSRHLVPTPACPSAVFSVDPIIPDRSLLLYSADGAANAERARINVERIRQVSALHASHRTESVAAAATAAAVSLQRDSSVLSQRH